MTGRFTVVCVCTGNIARSPAAERLLAPALGDHFRVGSAGTAALVGRGIDPPMAALVVGAGGDTGDFAARQVTPALLRAADLVLTLTREHRASTVDLAPATVRRTFTLREYARLVGELGPELLPAGSPVERAEATVSLAAARRRRSQADDDDVADPYRRSPEAYAAAFGAIEQAVAGITAVLRR
ncbi:hypothetical protein [uncultured Friedmanniella sp.]|uniref:arsenate reductase/protein-tyrosine-phosphatase family protein n=1 Tax=uncultured Friedmanniella sp. TaxID=335381 RepID=UPI0035CB9C40